LTTAELTPIADQLERSAVQHPLKSLDRFANRKNLMQNAAVTTLFSNQYSKQMNFRRAKPK
jgi:hypothetical protein